MAQLPAHRAIELARGSHSTPAIRERLSSPSNKKGFSPVAETFQARKVAGHLKTAAFPEKGKFAENHFRLILSLSGPCPGSCWPKAISPHVQFVPVDLSAG
jgi:hypothetical protein